MMRFYEIWWIDSLLTLIIAFYLIYMGWDLLKNSTKVLMLFTPDAIPVKKIVEEINAFEAIKNVHHVHFSHRIVHFGTVLVTQQPFLAWYDTRFVHHHLLLNVLTVCLHLLVALQKVLWLLWEFAQNQKR